MIKNLHLVKKFPEFFYLKKQCVYESAHILSFYINRWNGHEKQTM